VVTVRENQVFSIDLASVSDRVIGTTLLFFREDGEKIREYLIPHITKIDSEVIAFDFKNVKVIDFSCSDEIIVMLQEHNSWLKGKKIILDNLTTSHKENIFSALEKKKLAIWYRDGQDYKLLGKLPKHLIILLTIVKEKKQVTTRQISDELDEELPSISLKLGKLFKIGMLLRSEEKSSEGMQYIYKSII
jgi:hypothetical protein